MRISLLDLAAYSMRHASILATPPQLSSGLFLAGDMPVILFSAINLFMIFDPGFLIGIHHITVSPAADSDPSKPISFWRDCLKIKPSEFPNLFVDAFSQNFQIFADFSQHINCPAASSPTRSSWRARAASPPPWSYHSWSWTGIEQKKRPLRVKPIMDKKNVHTVFQVFEHVQ